MSVIIRLQNLPWSANALDIREFFKGLSIPEGGVHIVGGELGDAFIAFTTDEDARLAMQKSGSSLKGIQVTLLLSSRNEMQKVIEAARQQAMALQGFVPPPVIPTQPTSTQQPQPQTQPPQLPQPTMPGMQHQQMAAHTPYQAHGHPGGVDGPDQLPPHLPPHMVPQPGQPMVQPGSSMSLPPTTTAAQGPVVAGSLPPPPTTKAGDTQATATTAATTSASDKKDDKKSSSSSSSSRRDSKSRRRRTKSRSRTRSRSRDRDRRRRHRTRSRSRSRDRSSRSRRRSRSRDRDRGRDRTRDRDRDKDRSSRSGRDRSERGSLDKSDGSAAIIDISKENSLPLGMGGGGGGDGIPGLGEIPSMKGPLPISLAEPIKNSPIQTPSHSPGPTYSTAPFMAQPFQGGKMFGVGLPNAFGPMGAADMPLATKFNEPMETETVDDTPIVLEGPEGMPDTRGMRGSMAGQPRMDSKGGLLGDGPQGQAFGGFQSRGMAFRGSDNFGFGGGLGGRPHPDGDYMDPRGGRSDGGRQRDPRDRGFRGEMDPRDGRGKEDERGGRDDPNGWEGSSSGGSKRERSSRWEAVDKPEAMSDPSEWHSRGRRDAWGDREEDKWGSRGDSWKDDGFGRRDDRDSYDDPYGYGNYRGRGARGMERGRISRGGRGFNPRFGAYPGFSEENGDDAYAFRGGFRGRGSFRGSRGGGPFGFRDGSTEWMEETCSVELHNVPVGASYRAIRDFFHGIYVPKTGIKLLTDDHGNRIDVALLQFSSPRDAQRALRCSGNYIFDNKVEVVLTSEANYEAAIDANQMKMFPRGGGGGQVMSDAAWADSNCVCVSGVPPNCTEADILQFLNQYTVQEVVQEPEKARCLVRLSTAEAAHHAVATLNNTPDSPHLAVEVCPPDVFAAASRAKDPAKGGGQAGKDKKGEEKKAEKNGEEASSRHQPVGADLLTDSVVMKGVPKDATEANIRDFFSDEGLVPERFHFCDADGDGLRQVYVIFPLIEDARKAVGKSQQQLSKVKVDVELIAKPLVMASMGLPFDPLELIRKGQKTGETPFPGKPDSLASGDNKEETSTKKEAAQGSQEEGKDLLGQEDGGAGLGLGQDLLQGFGGPGLMGQVPYRGAVMAQFPGGPRAFRPFMARMPLGMAGMRGPADASFARMRGSLPLLRDPIDSSGSGSEAMGTAIPPEEFGKPGCVVSLGNVPYRATTEDILNFFRDFPQLRPENIIRRYNEFNQPTADARVSFRTPQEAQRAVQTLNRSYLSGRQVFLAMLPE